MKNYIMKQCNGKNDIIDGNRIDNSIYNLIYKIYRENYWGKCPLILNCIYLWIVVLWGNFFS